MTTQEINALRDDKIIAESKEKLTAAESRLQAARDALANAATNRVAAFDAHRQALLAGADTQTTAEAHAHACGQAALAEQLISELEGEVEQAKASHAQASIASWAGVHAKGREMRSQAAKSTDDLLRQIEAERIRYEEGTRLIQAANGAGYDKRMFDIPGLVLGVPGQAPRVPTAAQEASRWDRGEV